MQILYVQSVPAILSSILGGKTAAGTLSAPNTIKAKEAGLNLLVDVGKLNIPAFQVTYGATEKYLKNNPNTVYAFLKAIAEGVVMSRQEPAVGEEGHRQIRQNRRWADDQRDLRCIRPTGP